MKNWLTISALVLCLPAAKAQEAAAVVSEVFAPRYMLKTNVASYAWLSVNANYEQKVGPKITVGLLGGYKLPTVVHVDAIANIDGENQTYTGDIEPEGFYLNPYFRFYPKQAFKGFYVEAFLRYFDYSYLVPYDYEKNGGTIRANLDGTASAMGGGLGVGVQFELGPRVYLDLNAGYGMAMGDAYIRTSDPNLEPEDYVIIKQNIEKYEDDADVQVFILGDVLTDPEAYAYADYAEAYFRNKVFPIVRGGITIGFAF
ncbi:MAG: DUF3575 domain-containing protein [Flavobacteriales bacterium]|nr:DUF3575 domain-containing protein [Flavobacteriales bacterium]